MGAKYLCPRHPTVHTRRKAHHEVLQGSGAPSWGVIGQGFIYLFSVRIFATSHTLKSPGTEGRPTAVSEAEQIAVDGHSKGYQPSPTQPNPNAGHPGLQLGQAQSTPQPVMPAPGPSPMPFPVSHPPHTPAGPVVLSHPDIHTSNQLRPYSSPYCEHTSWDL